MRRDSDMLTDMNIDELAALADAMLAPSAQSRLDELLSSREALPLPPADDAELDRLLEKVDQLTILKTRARYTLA